MTLAEIWPTLRNLSHEDKRALVEALTAEMAREEETSIMNADQTYAVWSPHDANEAAAKLQRYLDESGSSK